LLDGITPDIWRSWAIAAGILIGMMVIARSHLQRQACFAGFCALLAGAVVGLLGLAWIVRDGLGPDAVVSSGLEAVRRFAADTWPAAVGATALGALAATLNRWTKKRIERSRNRQVRPDREDSGTR
jgi:hypothetical protein